MKVFVFIFATLLMGVTALPSSQDYLKDIQKAVVQQTAKDLVQRNLVADIVAGVIGDVSKWIQDNGLDPFELIEFEAQYSLPVPVIFTAAAYVERVFFRGLSNIVIEEINYAILASRLTFRIVIPDVTLDVDRGVAAVVVFGNEYGASGEGSLKVTGIQLIGDVRISIGVISGVSVRSLILQLSIGNIQSDVNLNVLGYDLSDQVNDFIQDTVPEYLEKFESEINELVEYIGWILIDRFL